MLMWRLQYRVFCSTTVSLQISVIEEHACRTCAGPQCHGQCLLPSGNIFSKQNHDVVVLRRLRRPVFACAQVQRDGRVQLPVPVGPCAQPLQKLRRVVSRLRVLCAVFWSKRGTKITRALLCNSWCCPFPLSNKLILVCWHTIFLSFFRVWPMQLRKCCRPRKYAMCLALCRCGAACECISVVSSHNWRSWPQLRAWLERVRVYQLEEATATLFVTLYDGNLKLSTVVRPLTSHTSRWLRSISLS